MKSERDIELYLDAIRQYMPDHSTVSATDSTWLEEPLVSGAKQLWFYVNDPPRDEVDDGENFTFIVMIDRRTASVVRVAHYRSRKRGDGDDTLPP